MSRRGVDLGDRLDALARAVDLGAGRCDPAALAPARALLDRAAARRRLSPERTVVALAGGTGSGKSTLFNALAGATLAPTGVRRPMTSRPRAAIWPPAPDSAAGADGNKSPTGHASESAAGNAFTVDTADNVAALLDWLDIRDRDVLDDDSTSLAGRSVAGRSVAGTTVGDTSVAGTTVGDTSVAGTTVGDTSVAGPSGGRASWAASMLGGKSASRAALADRALADRALADTALDGLVLVDLPDFDSTAAAHRVEAERMTQVVDLLVWVVDPQKYADAALHERYLRPLAAHRDVTMVVLNQADRLDPQALAACLRHLGVLLADDGLPGVPLLATSAARGDGLPELRAALADRVRERSSATARLQADADAAVTALESQCTSASARTGRGAKGGEDELVRALSEAAGAGQAADASARSYRMRATTQVGWPVTSWLSRLRPDPVRRLHLAPGSSGPQSRASSGTQRAQVSNAVRDLVASRTTTVAPAWQAAARTAVESHQDEVAGELDKAVRAGVPPSQDRPHWWAAVRLLQWAFLAAAVAGLLWLAGLAAFAYLRLPQPDFHVGRAPLPTLLLVGGLLAGLATSLLVRPFVAAGASRRRARARRALDTGVREVARRCIVAPLDAELVAASEFCAAVDAARR